MLLIGFCPLQYSCDLFRFGEEMIGANIANKPQLPLALRHAALPGAELPPAGPRVHGQDVGKDPIKSPCLTGTEHFSIQRCDLVTWPAHSYSDCRNIRYKGKW